MTIPLTPPRLLDLLRRSLQTWLTHQPTFATSPATAPLRRRLHQAEDPSPHQVPHLIEALQQDIVWLQVAFHEAGHAATTYTLTSEEDVWDLHLWFADDPEQDTGGEVHAGRTYLVERYGWPASAADLRAKLATILAGTFFHPRLPSISFTGAEQGDELEATVLAARLGWTLEDAHAYTQRVVDRQDLHDAVNALALEAFGNLLRGVHEVDADTTARILGRHLTRPRAATETA